MTRTRRAAAQRIALAMAETPKRPAVKVELIATVALALCTVVAVTAVSIGIARAEVVALGRVADAASLATGLLVALLLVVMGGLTAVLAGNPEGQA